MWWESYRKSRPIPLPDAATTTTHTAIGRGLAWETRYWRMRFAALSPLEFVAAACTGCRVH